MADPEGDAVSGRQGSPRTRGSNPEERLAELDAVFAALAHRARRQILMTLYFRGGEMTAGDIAKRFEHAWPTTTRHLKVLEEAGLVTAERQAQTRLYRLAPDKLKVIEGWTKWFSGKEKR